MENLKMYSLRVEPEFLKKADNVAESLSYHTRSDVLRLAIWVGLKFINPRNYSKLSFLRWSTGRCIDNIPLEDVIHAAGVLQEHINGSK